MSGAAAVPVEHLPLGAHLLIATRADPGLRLGRLRAGGQLAEIRAADLAFNPEEVRALLAKRQVEWERGAQGGCGTTPRDGLRRWVWPSCRWWARTDPDAFVRQPQRQQPLHRRVPDR